MEESPSKKSKVGKNLDVSFDSKLNFTEHISSKVKKANQIVPISIIRTTDYSKGFLRSLALQIIEV